MTRAVGMFGSDAAVVRLHNTLKNGRVHLERHNFKHPDDILARLSEAPEITAVLFVEKALKEHDPDIAATLESFRSSDTTVRIIFIKDEPERDYGFECWCYERGIYDIFYPSRHTDVNIDAIRDAVLLGRIDLNNPPPFPPDPNAETEPVERTKLLEKLSLPEIKLPEWRFPEWKIPSLSKFVRKPRQEPEKNKNEPNLPPQQELDIRTIGVINCSRGFGATSLTVGMTRSLHDAGYSVAAVAMDFSPDLEYSGLYESGVTVIVPSGGQLPDWDALKAEHDFVLVDFGAIYDFLPSGNVIPAQSNAASAVAVRDAMKLCDLRIYLASAEPWHKRKAKAFSPDEKGYVILRQEAHASEILLTIGAIS